VGVSPTLNPIYDLDGNATSYPLPVSPNANSTLTYDGENRMTSTTVNGITEYEKGTGVSPVLTLKKTYLWGIDLSGSIQGAGGVGGLLCESNISNPQSPICYPTYDGNGNISEYLTATGSVAAHFEYDPFGNTTINTDTTNQFTYKFSTKPQDVETGLYYYGYRYYDAVAGRWISRDPLEEKGGVNLYAFVANSIINNYDKLGLDTIGPGYGSLPIPELNPIVDNGDGSITSVAAHAMSLENNLLLIYPIGPLINSQGSDYYMKISHLGINESVILGGADGSLIEQQSNLFHSVCSGKVGDSIEINTQVGGWLSERRIWTVGHINLLVVGKLTKIMKGGRCVWQFSGKVSEVQRIFGPNLV
jgi:RHS repeat-associated protein